MKRKGLKLPNQQVLKKEEISQKKKNTTKLATVQSMLIDGAKYNGMPNKYSPIFNSKIHFDFYFWDNFGFT